MKKLNLIFVALLLTSAVSVYSGGFAGGTGTKNDPFLVATAQQLNEVRNYPDKYFLQTADISLDVVPFNMGNYWVPIGGRRNNNDIHNNFTGHYDGRGFRITDLIIVQPGNGNVGLFGHIGKSGDVATTIKNVRLYNVIVIGGRGTGALVGRVTGNQNTRIENCSVELGYVSGDAATGGLIGSNNSYMITSVAAEGFRPVIYKCNADVSVLLRSEYSEGKIKFGGLVGCNQKGMISHCYSKGEVIVDNTEVSFVGGLAGCIDLRGIIINSYSLTAVYADSASNKGGLIGSIGHGRNQGMVYNSYWSIENNMPGFNSPAGEGLTNEQLKNQQNFENWDFANIWNVALSNNDGYPYFIDNKTVKTDKTWTGILSSSWSEGGNWSPEGVPAANEMITIPSGTNYSPEISSAITIFNLSLYDGVQLNLVGEQSSITIKGTLTGGSESVGTASVTGEGRLIWAGNTLQSIPSMTYGNMVVNNPNNVKLAGSITINNTLQMHQGLLDLRGFEIILSEEARLFEIENDNISSRVYGSAGVIRTQRVLDNPAGDIAGLGLEIISSNNLGLTLIERGHSALNEGDESKSILRWFNIEPTVNQNLDATLIFHYFVSELNVYGENDNFSLFRRKHGDTEWVWIPSELDALNQVLTAYEVNEFSTWTAGSTDKPLPIVLYSWEAEAVNNAVELNWITAAEINNDYFTIERSRNGIDFEIIATVNGAGTSSRSNYYSSTDASPINGLAYYRLKQTDFNGAFEYSKTITVVSKKHLANEIRIFPNPSNGNFNILCEGDQSAEYRIYDLQGRMVSSSTIEPGMMNTVSLPNLKAGIYQVVISGDETSTQKIQIL
jgi:hypothetical protein